MLRLTGREADGWLPSLGYLMGGPPSRWVDDLVELALEYGISGFILAADDGPVIQRYAEEVAPAVRERVASERAGAGG